MKLRRAWFITMSIFLIFQGGVAQIVKHGKIDLSDWDIDREPVKALNGAWAFYWNELLQAEDIYQKPAERFIQFSMPWNEQPIAGEKIPDKGFATYYAEVILPPGTDSLAIEVPAVYNSYELWINDEKVSSNGKVGRSKESTIPMWKPVTCGIRRPDTLRIVFQVANFHHVRGGSIAPIHIGKAEELFKKDAAQVMSAKILVISCLVLCLYGMALFFFTQRVPAGYFGALVTAMAIRAMFSDPYLFHRYIPDISWIIAVKIEYITVPLLSITGILFVSSIYPMEVRKASKYFFMVVNIIFCIPILAAGPEFFSKFLIVFQAMAVAEAIYCFYVIIKAIVNERIGSWLSCASIVILVLVVFYNLLVYLLVFELNYFIISAGYLLSFILTAAAIYYRSSDKIEAEGMLKYSDLYNTEE
jgi:hypothetical protein